MADYWGREVARRKLLLRRRNRGAKLGFGFAAVGQIENDGFAVAFLAVVFVEDRLRHHILFASPISEVALAASFAAKRKFRMNSRICSGLTYWAFVLHIVLPGL